MLLDAIELTIAEVFSSAVAPAARMAAPVEDEDEDAEAEDEDDAEVDDEAEDGADGEDELGVSAGVDAAEVGAGAGAELSSPEQAPRASTAVTASPAVRTESGRGFGVKGSI